MQRRCMLIHHLKRREKHNEVPVQLPLEYMDLWSLPCTHSELRNLKNNSSKHVHSAATDLLGAARCGEQEGQRGAHPS